MRQDQFKQLKVGDRVTHPAFIGFLTIVHIELYFRLTLARKRQELETKVVLWSYEP